MRAALRSSHGHTLLELMVACSLLLVVMGALVALAVPAHDAFLVQPEMADLQQRLRAVVDALHRDLSGAGAGVGVGVSPGPLTFFAPAVLPYRYGASHAGFEPPGSFRPDAITILSVVSPSAQCLTAEPIASPSAPIPVRLVPGCPLNDPACGFDAGMRALVADGRGTWDAITVTGVQFPTGQLEHIDQSLSSPYPAGSIVAALQMHVYYVRNDPSTGTPQLMRSDGVGSDMPLADHIVSLMFEYFGSADPPNLLRPADDPAGPWTSYGPRPPPLGAQDEGEEWPAGENCVFKVEGGRQVSRLERIGAGAGALGRLEPGMLVDGPWCPSPSASNRFDADLLRVRTVRVTFRVEAAAEILRGTAGAWFARPGSSRGGTRYLPDQSITIDVALRNLAQLR